MSDWVIGPWHKKILSLFEKESAERLKRKDLLRVADIGCDEGIILLEIAKRHRERVELYGIDLREDAIELAVSRARQLGLSNVKFEYGYFLEKDFSMLPKFDVVIFSEVYEHLLAEYQIKGLRIVGELLADDGVLLMTIPNGDYLLSIERKKTFDEKYPENFFADLRQTHHWMEPKLDEMKRTMISLGFDVKEIGYFNLPGSGRLKTLKILSEFFEGHNSLLPFYRKVWKQMFVKASKNQRSPFFKGESLY